MISSDMIEQMCGVFGYAGPIEVTAHASYGALLQAIHNRGYTVN